VVGYSGAATGQRAFLLESGVMTNLGDLTGGIDYSLARRVNNSGQVVGDSGSATGIRAFMWQNGVMTALGGLAEQGTRSYANDINNAGQVVGYSTTADGVRAFMWQNGSTTDLGDGIAYGINNAGLVVGMNEGSVAAMWQNGTMTLLNTLVGVDGTGWDLIEAQAVNDLGQIVGYGVKDDEVHGFILTPVPEPEVYLMMGVGVCLAGVIARRRKQVSQ
jgi:probable HAF family extracellular repeat protein